MPAFGLLNATFYEVKGHLLPAKRYSFTKHCISRCYVRYANHKEKNFIKNKKNRLNSRYM